MSRRPTLHLTNLSSRRQHGPGRLLCAMAAPRRHELGASAGVVMSACPTARDLRAVRAGDISVDEYRERCERYWRTLLTVPAVQGATPIALAPNGLTFGRWGDESLPLPYVQDDDTLFCACARPDSPKRTHPCHLEWLAPYLARAGWDVVLYGRRLTMLSSDPLLVGMTTEGWPIMARWADTGDPYTGAWEPAPARQGRLL